MMTFSKVETMTCFKTKSRQSSNMSCSCTWPAGSSRRVWSSTSWTSWRRSSSGSKTQTFTWNGQTGMLCRSSSRGSTRRWVWSSNTSRLEVKHLISLFWWMKTRKS